MRTILLSLATFAAACPGDDAGPIEPTYANVAGVIERSCAISSSCHSEGGQGGLTFDGVADYTTVLAGVPACEYDLLARVNPGQPDNSWLMIKLDGEYDSNGNILFEPSADWEPDINIAVQCPLNDGDEVIGFGTNMPQSVGMATPLPSREIEMFRAWIEAGAPGPDA